MRDTNEAVIITTTQDPSRIGVEHHRAYLPSTLEDYQPCIPLFDVLHAAGPEDTVTMIINGDGGWVTTASHLATAVSRSQATVVTEVYGRASSAHTLTMLCGDIILPVRNAIVMSHNMSMGSFGSGEEPIKHVEASLKWAYSLFEEYHLPFLSMSELESIFEYNNTIWLSDEEDINNRIFTTMWLRAAIGNLKDNALDIFLAFFKAGAYEGCQLVHLDTLVEFICQTEEVGVAPIWKDMEHAGLFGDTRNPMDYIDSLTKEEN